MKTVHYEAGYVAAKNGAWRAAPKNLKIVTQPWRDWYEGFDASVRDNNHPKLTAKFRERRKSRAYEVRP